MIWNLNYDISESESVFYAVSRVNSKDRLKERYLVSWLYAEAVL